ncbi:MAG: cobalt ECF transporter T component CbiQ [Deferribacteraceae bacterium]|jgi:cobalt/nickel transport system permease protein|nr:cobalt ECF transporter T component CbiQ [Deferribacteraceae bacterium]
MRDRIQELYALEQLSGGNSCVHRLHPTVKLLTTVFFIITVVSFDRYAFGRLIPYIFYPTLMMALSEIPYIMLLKRFLVTLPFCLFAGVTNVIFDNEPAFLIGGVAVSYGLVSLFTILFRTYLCVMALLVLISVTPFSEITKSMRRLKAPHIFIVIFEMTYRYIAVLFEEAYSMYIAYTLRSAGAKGIRIKDMGSFVGQLVLRSLDRAERVYNAMKCRGYALHNLPQSTRKLTHKDLIFLAVTCFLCAAFRCIVF